MDEDYHIIEKCDNINTLVIAGGSVRGLCIVGALNYLLEQNYINIHSIHTFSGTSIGSTICLLLICGYSPLEIFQKVYDTKTFVDFSNYKFKDIIQHYGVFSIDMIANHLHDMIMLKYGFIPSFQELYDMTHKTLYVCAVNVTKGCAEYFSHTTHPDMSVLHAVKMSCSIPGIFHRQEYNNCYYVDGGVLDNFPLKIVDKLNNKILGIYLSSRTETEYTNVDSFTSWMVRLLSLPINKLQDALLNTVSDRCQLIKLQADIGIIDFNMTDEQKVQLFISGYSQGMTWYLNYNNLKWNW